MADRPRLKSPLDDPPEPAEKGPAKEADTPAAPARPRLRFGIGAMLGVTFVVAFAAAGYGAVTRGGENHAYYVIFALMTPFLALTIASIVSRLKRGRKQQRPTEEDPWR